MSLSRISAALSAVVLAAGIAACGGPETPVVAPTPTGAPTAVPDVPTAAPTPTAVAVTPPPSATPAVPTPPPAPQTWKDMNQEQRIALMKKDVMPKAIELFQAFDGKKYGTVTCATCHGEGAKQGKFDMPNEKLPVLTPKDGFKKHLAKTPAITKFMMEKLTPEVMKLIPGATPYDPATHKGFGCGACHKINAG